MNEQMDLTQLKDLLRAAADEEPRADLVAQAWAEAGRRKRRTRRVSLGLVTAGVLAVAGAWFGNNLIPFAEEEGVSPAGEGDEPVIGSSGMTTFVFQPRGESSWEDLSQGGAYPRNAVPGDPGQLARTAWELDGLLMGTVTAWPEEPSTDVPDQVWRSELLFTTDPDGVLSLVVRLSTCGEVARIENVSTGDDGSLSGHPVGTGPDQNCTADDAAVQFWPRVLEQAWLHSQGEVVYLSVDARQDQASAGPTGGDQPLTVMVDPYFVASTAQDFVDWGSHVVFVEVMAEREMEPRIPLLSAEDTAREVDLHVRELLWSHPKAVTALREDDIVELEVSPGWVNGQPVVLEGTTRLEVGQQYTMTLTDAYHEGDQYLADLFGTIQPATPADAADLKTQLNNLSPDPDRAPVPGETWDARYVRLEWQD